MVTDAEAFLSNITLGGDFDALNASNQLEMKRAMIYNYLILTGMPLASDIVLVKGILRIQRKRKVTFFRLF